MSRISLIDLDAARREAEVPDALPLTYKGQDFALPAELPADVFDPLLSEDLDLVGIVKPFLADGIDYGQAVIDLLTDRPGVPGEVVGAIHGVFAALFGEGDYARFRGLKPSLSDYGRLVKALVPAYGIDLGEAFASPASSESDGATQKQTSEPSTDSTAAPSGAAKASSQGSSASAD